MVLHLRAKIFSTSNNESSHQYLWIFTLPPSSAYLWNTDLQLQRRVCMWEEIIQQTPSLIIIFTSLSRLTIFTSATKLNFGRNVILLTSQWITGVSFALSVWHRISYVSAPKCIFNRECNVEVWKTKSEILLVTLWSLATGTWKSTVHWGKRLFAHKHVN